MLHHDGILQANQAAESAQNVPDPCQQKVYQLDFFFGKLRGWWVVLGRCLSLQELIFEQLEVANDFLACAETVVDWHAWVCLDKGVKYFQNSS